MFRNCRSVVIKRPKAPRHQVEIELFEPLGRLGNVGDRPATDQPAQPRSRLRISSARLTARFRAPVLDVRLG